MDEQIFESHAPGGEQISMPQDNERKPASGTLALYIGNLNKLRDIYIDSSLFRNAAWDVFLALYIRHQEGLRATLASLGAGNRLSEADCIKAVEELENAGLVQRESGESEQGPHFVALTDQGLQRMDAFLLSADRA